MGNLARYLILDLSATNTYTGCEKWDSSRLRGLAICFSHPDTHLGCNVFTHSVCMYIHTCIQHIHTYKQWHFPDWTPCWQASGCARWGKTAASTGTHHLH